MAVHAHQRRFDHDQARQLHRDGVSVAELARRYNVTEGAVRQVVTKTGKTSGQQEAEHRAQLLAAPLTARCLWCDWTYEGTAAEGRDAAAAHRAAAHPGVKPAGRRRDRSVREKLADVHDKRRVRSGS